MSQGVWVVPGVPILALAPAFQRNSNPRGKPRGDRELCHAACDGHPSLADLATRYSERSGRDVSDLHWYVAFAAFKLAVILEGVHYRYVQGKTVGEGFDTIGGLVGPLVRRGHEALEGN